MYKLFFAVNKRIHKKVKEGAFCRGSIGVIILNWSVKLDENDGFLTTRGACEIIHEMKSTNKIILIMINVYAFSTQ